MLNFILAFRNFAILTLALACTSSAFAAQDADSELLWPGFRGPNGNGTSLTAKPPTVWSNTENIAWKQRIPGRGSSSPIVVGKRVYITAATPADSDNAPRQLTQPEITKKFDANRNGQLDGNEQRAARAFLQSQRTLLAQKQKFMVLCYDRASGDPIWEKVATEAMPHEAHHPDHGYASASPATDGNYLYINFGSYGLYCYDLEGNLRWKRDDLGKMQTRGTFGQGSSVALHDNILILPWDHEGQSRIEAIDCDTGETIWKKMRDEPTAWATPLVVEVDDRKQVIHSGQNYSRGYDLNTGEEIWKASGLSQRPVACPTVFGNTGFFASFRRGAVLQAIPLNQTGDISQNGIVWSINRQTPDVPSLLLSENRLYFTGGNNGILTCVNAETGEPFFNPQRLPIGGVYSSPVAANGNVFITSRDGETVVIRDAVTFSVVSRNDIGEPVDSTLALADDEIFIRGRDHLFCVRNK
ncbi:outer membrane protein assembly factor BamB family protein [Mariniblastus fucicola]|uniref:Outer membrane biogenesis protein BamB n=1 Tax=Mariniblastus fucicola TaxID=980251 RepID=A0A5B9PB94_9BACT|nr:PQQ-binding-like beta-propeller repeat protein [Mariniblastus fucicola]QEG23997.1 outer membrane biogenesis protein BamB [Mariniblastus fucicola]